MTDVATLTIAEFLLARIAEDEAVARAAGEPDMVEERKPSGKPTGRLVPTGETLHAYAAGLARDEDAPEDAVELIQRFDPARVLAECEAKRKIVERCQRAYRLYLDTFAHEHLADDVLDQLAVPYAGHPDYRDEWKP